MADTEEKVEIPTIKGCLDIIGELLKELDENDMDALKDKIVDAKCATALLRAMTGSASSITLSQCNPYRRTVNPT